MSSLARVRVDWTDVHEHAGKPRSQHTGTLLGDALVVIGGVRGGSTLSDVACLDLNSGSWRTVETAGVAFEARSSHTATLVGDTSIWVIGGKRAEGDGGAELCTQPACVVLDVLSRSWESPELRGDVRLLSRLGHCAVLHPHMPHVILVHGGFRPGEGHLDDLLAVDTQSRTVLPLHPMPPSGPPFRPRCFHAAATLGSRVVFLSGQSAKGLLGEDQSIAVLDLGTAAPGADGNPWHALAWVRPRRVGGILPAPRSHATAAAVWVPADHRPGEGLQGVLLWGGGGGARAREAALLVQRGGAFEWVPVQAPQRSPALAKHAMAHLGRGELVLFGGSEGSRGKRETGTVWRGQLVAVGGETTGALQAEARLTYTFSEAAEMHAARLAAAAKGAQRDRDRDGRPEAAAHVGFGPAGTPLTLPTTQSSPAQPRGAGSPGRGAALAPAGAGPAATPAKAARGAPGGDHAGAGRRSPPRTALPDAGTPGPGPSRRLLPPHDAPDAEGWVSKKRRTTASPAVSPRPGGGQEGRAGPARGVDAALAGVWHESSGLGSTIVTGEQGSTCAEVRVGPEWEVPASVGAVECTPPPPAALARSAAPVTVPEFAAAEDLARLSKEALVALLVQYKAEERQWLRAAEARQREATEQEAEVRKVRNAVAWGEAAEQEAEVRKLRRELDLANASWKHAVNERNGLQARGQEVQGEVEALGRELHAARAVAKDWELRAAEAERKEQAARMAEGAAEERRKRDERDRCMAEERERQAREERLAMERARIAAEEELCEARARVADLESRCKDASDKVAQLARQVGLHTEDMRRWEEERRGLQVERDRLQRWGEEVQREARAAAEEAKARATEDAAKIRSLQQELDEAVARARHLSEEAGKLRADVAQEVANGTRARQEAERLRSSLSRIAALDERRSEDLVALSSVLDRLRRGRDGVATELQNALQGALHPG